jgi:hypothetical protein
VHGKADTSALTLTEAAFGDAGFLLLGTPGQQLGVAVSGAGDVDGDGLDDIIVGSDYYDSTGAAFVVYGKADTDSVLIADVLDGIGGFALVGELANDAAGRTVSTAGDVNADGFADVIVGAPYEGGGPGGRAYVVFGGDFRFLDL